MNKGDKNYQKEKILLKLTLGISALMFIFLSPYLSLTEISINMSLFDSIIYSSMIIGFWGIATLTLQKRKPATSKIQKHSKIKPIVYKRITTS